MTIQPSTQKAGGPMKGLTKLAAGMVVFALATPGIASANPDVDDPMPPQPTSPFAVPGDDSDIRLNFHTGSATDVAAQQSAATYFAPPLAHVSFLPYSAPKSLVVYRGTNVVAQVTDIGAYSAIPQGNELYINPPSLQPVWVGNVGSPFGSAMGTALIAAHNVVRGERSPLYNIVNARPGDMVDVMLRTGDIMRFQVTPQGIATPLKGVSEFEDAPRMLEVVICAPDGEHLFRLRAEQV